jgi:hypothetical protein
VKPLDYAIQIILLIGKTFASALFSPFFLLMIFLVGWQYKRIQRGNSGTPGEQNRRYLRSTLVATLTGIIGGVLGSILMVVAGIDLAGIGFQYLFVLALLMMLISPRFICFAYAGGILSLCHLTLGFPQIDVAHVMGLVAILHMVESMLILTTGHVDPVPVYVTRSTGEVVGGFNLQKFWPIPLVAVMSAGMVSGGWWSLVGEHSNSAFNIYAGMVPVLAILGYGEVTTTAPPARRTRISACYLAMFSVILFSLALLGSHHPSLLFLPALFGPLGHEMTIAIGQRAELTRPPLYVQPREGVMVLDVARGSQAHRAGLQSLDVILAVNGIPIGSGREFQQALNNARMSVLISCLRGGKRLNLQLVRNGYQELGLILVPEAERALSPVPRHAGFWSGLTAWMKRIWR